MAAKKMVTPRKTLDWREKPATGLIKGNTSRDHIHRMYVILAELQNGRRPTKRKLAELCGDVSTKTIERDIKAMESLMDVDIPYDNSKGGYWIEGEVKHFPMMKLENRDLLTLHFLRQCLVPYGGTDIGRSMIASFDRAFGILTGTADWKTWEETVWFRFEGKPETAKSDADLFDLLYGAAKAGEKIAFDYLSQRKNTPERREVEPAFIYMRNGRWYLYAVDGPTGAARTFAFPRISNAASTGQKFNRRHLAPRDVFRYSFGVAAGEKRPKENVILEFSPDVAMRVHETVWHPEQRIDTLPDGRVRLSLPLAEDCYFELKPWLLSWGPKVKVIAPRTLRDDYRATVRETAKASAGR